MELSLADLYRRMDNMLRFGTIAEVKYAKTPQVRVQAGKLLSNWLPLKTAQAGKTRTWTPPAIGEQCMIFSPSGDMSAGMVMPGINSNNFLAPEDDQHSNSTEFEDGARIAYNSESHHYQISLPAAGKLTLTVGATTLELSNEGTRLITPRFEGVQA